MQQDLVLGGFLSDTRDHIKHIGEVNLFLYLFLDWLKFQTWLNKHIDEDLALKNTFNVAEFVMCASSIDAQQWNKAKYILGEILEMEPLQY